MFNWAKRKPVSKSEHKEPSENIGGIFIGHRRVFDTKFEEQFRLLREECTRTLLLMRKLRASPHYRFASVDAHYDGDADVRRP